MFVLPLSCVFSLLLALAGPIGESDGRTASAPPPKPAVPLGLDLVGKPISRLAGPETSLVVLFFAASDCPISNRYIPEMNRLRREFEPRHVAFWWVFPNPSDTAGVVREHIAQFALEGNTILDTQQTLAQLAHATVTPESAVFRADGDSLREVYRGRIDDRYISLGTERPQATEHTLEAAIDAALANRLIVRPVTQPVGCSIVPRAAK